MIERRIVIGLITSTEYLRQIKPDWDIQLMESTAAKRLAGWCWEYFDKYNKAPEGDIEGIFYSKIKSGKFPKDIAEEIEQDILPGLSKEYANGSFNLEYLLEETKKHFRDRRLDLHSNIIQTLRSQGELEEAEKVACDFKPLSLSSVNLENFILSVQQIRRHKKSSPITLMRPWLKGGQITIIYANYGVGKSLIAILVGYMVGLQEFQDGTIGEWQVVHPTGTLYIDGELGEVEMEERIKQFEWIGRQQGDYRMRILSVPEYQLATQDSFYLSDRTNQLKVLRWLKDYPTYKLIILDSASTLFGIEDENSNSEWSNKVNPFLRDLRALGVSCLLLHHAGKDNKRGLRGASAMGAMAQNIYRLTNHGSKDPDAGEAWFVLSKEKQRAGGFQFRNFSLHFMQSTNHRETHWEVTSTQEE